MNFAEYTVKFPFDSHYERHVTNGLGRAQASLDHIFREKLQLEDKAPAVEGEAPAPIDLAAVAERAGAGALKDCYAQAGGDSAKLVELMQAAHAKR